LVQFFLFYNLNVKQDTFTEQRNINTVLITLKRKHVLGEKRGLENLDGKWGPGQNPEQYSSN
jgi:hypothetical protein